MTSTKNLQSAMTHLLMTVIVFFSMIAIAVAQTTPTTPDRTKQPPQQPGTTQQQPTQQDQGWRWFNDNSVRELQLDADRMSELRAMDDRYRREYNALGTTPWTHSNYQALTDRRNMEIKRILTPDQYERWSRSSMQGTSPAQSPDRTTTPTTPRDPNTPTPRR